MEQKHSPHTVDKGVRNEAEPSIKQFSDGAVTS